MFASVLRCGLPMILAASAATAQTLGLPDAALARIPVSGGGWSQVFAVDELLLFALDTAFTLALAAALAFHPARAGAPRSLENLALPPLFFLYALIGMAIGFLVEQHGYVIGFVVFGIGGLVRFRSNLDEIDDTVELILVTFIGLTVGLNLPVMAALITAAGWLVIAASARLRACEIEIKAVDAAGLDAALDALRRLAESRRWQVIALRRGRRKPNATLLMRAPGAGRGDAVEAALEEALQGQPAEWKLRV
ncbi:hypothetical protein [Rubrimonas cliftonensis]|uniref:DUF4956 domain-containing protein n=1 Tax=Rubrimonas cliftonensis TaxID=89524 RepID=A0A1H4FRD8_9RHOB|nr:hypothetical protein [Rubrimonas cliftonensis]SEA99238.1 hypothetical protein SAMN05444370_12623 [Rubrimonas cliftonensis]